MIKCPACKKEYKNLGSHARFCKGNSPEAPERILKEDKPYTSYPISPGNTRYKYNFWPIPMIRNIFKREKSNHAKIKIEMPELKTILLTENKLPRWCIKERKPFFKPKKQNANWIQIAAFSRTRPPVFCWAEYDGVSVSIGDMFFPAPSEIRGNVFPYDMDRGIPLLENTDQFQDMSYWNKLVERVKNMYFTLGLVTGSGDFTKNIGLILLLVGLSLLGNIINIIMTYTLTTNIELTSMQIGNITREVQLYVQTHP